MHTTAYKLRLMLFIYREASSIGIAKLSHHHRHHRNQHYVYCYTYIFDEAKIQKKNKIKQNKVSVPAKRKTIDGNRKFRIVERAATQKHMSKTIVY